MFNNPFLTRVREFFRGRSGMDALNIALLVLWVAVRFVTGFFESRWLRLIPLVFPALFLFRALSKNTDHRVKENIAFLKVWEAVTGFFKRTGTTVSEAYARFLDRKSYRYPKCPTCGTRVRIPRGKGTVRITCPRCGNRFEKRV